MKSHFKNSRSLFVLLLICLHITLFSPESAIADNNDDIHINNASASNVDSNSNNVIRWGFITSNPAQIINEFQPFIDWLAEDMGCSEGEIVPAANIAQMSQNLLEGRIDFYNDSPLGSVIINSNSGARPFLMQQRKGQKSYHSVIFARKDGMVSECDDLKGKTIAFENQNSTSGFLLPAAHIISLGHKLYQAGNPEEGVAYKFSNSHENTVFQVLFNRVDAGATSDLEYDALPDNIKSELNIIAITPSVPRFVVSTSPNISSDLLARLKISLVKMNENPEGAEFLKNTLENSLFFEINDKYTKMMSEAENIINNLIEHGIIPPNGF